MVNSYLNAVLQLIVTVCAVLKHKHLTEVLVFFKDFRNSTESLKSSAACFKINARLSLSLHRISENQLCKKNRILKPKLSILFNLRMPYGTRPVVC